MAKKLTKKEKVKNIIPIMEDSYPALKSELNHSQPYELLMAVRLSAQCTDERVNKVTDKLFKTYTSLEEFSNAKLEDVKKIIYSCGFYNRKSEDLIEMSKMLLDKFDGKVPDNMDDLLSLPGIGRKTANLILGDIYDVPGVVIADTHCIRITNLIGLTTSKNPDIVETELRKLLPPEKSNDFCHRMVLHGRAVCVARRPDCENCMIENYCDNGIKAKKKREEEKNK